MKNTLNKLSNFIDCDSNAIISEDLSVIAQYDIPWRILKNKTLLITGGAGFIGSYLIKSLLTASQFYQLNIKVICITRDLSNLNYRLTNLKNFESLKVITHDICEPLPKDIPRADYVIHCASHASPKYYGVDPVGTLLSNTVGTKQLLAYAQSNGSEKFVFFSSGEVYGIPPRFGENITEVDFGYMDPMDLRSCYGESKRIGEAMCASWSNQYGLNTSVIRPFHTYGPSLFLDDGRVFSDFIADVIAKRNIVVKGDGLAMRPFCYISDAITGFLTVILKGECSQAYNIGNPNAEISVRDLALLVANIFPERNIGVDFLQSNPNPNYLPSKISRSCPSIDKIRSLGWQPKIALIDGFRRTIESYLLNDVT
jgi:UDP-glucuronate decarboxylase